LLLVMAGASCQAVRPNAEGARTAPVYTSSDTTARLAPGVISTGHDFGTTLAPDGRTMFFTRRLPTGAGTQLMRTEWRGSAWSAPQRAPFSTGPHDELPQLLPDGKQLLFSAPRRRNAATNDADGDWDIWRVKLDGLSLPVRDASPANTPADETSPSASIDDAMFFARAARGDSTASTLYYWSPALRSSAVAVSVGNEVTRPLTPYVNRTGRVLLLSARPVAPRGRADLYVMVRRGDGRWSAPRALGHEVNSPDTEYAPTLSPDERYLFFSRERFEQNRAVGTDIFVVPVRSVPVLRDALAERP
jgi:Tol biopolymer transport system component